METITVQPRAPELKARQLRREGAVPGVIFGAALPASIAVQMDAAAARRLRRTKRVGSKLCLRLGEQSYPVLIRDLDYDSISEETLHIGFQLLDAGRRVNSVADIVLLNQDKVAGVLEKLQMQVAHAAAPQFLLDTVTVDLAGLTAGSKLTVGDIPAFGSANIELLTDPAAIVVRVSEKRRLGTRDEA